MKNIAIIPARGGSKRLPNKNTLLLDGLPLLVHSIHYAQKNASIIDDIYVSTDDDAIRYIALQFGAKVIDRPAAISGDLEPTITTLQHALKTLDHEVDTIILLQPTNPLRPIDLLQECYNAFQENQVDSLFTVSRNHQKLGKINNHKYIPFNYEIGQRSQDITPLYFENGLLYICKGSLVSSGKIISESAFPYEVNHPFATLDIDTQHDLDYAQYLIQNSKFKI